MTVSSAAYLKSLHNTTLALGDKAISSDAQMVIEGFEDIKLLIKQFPWPVLTSAGEIEVPMSMGSAHWQAQQLKPAQQGSITFMETVKGHISEFLAKVIKQNGGYFNATIYEGTEENYSRKCKITRCMLQLDPVDRDMENRSQILLVTGTMFYHYFGDE